MDRVAHLLVYGSLQDQGQSQWFRIRRYDREGRSRQEGRDVEKIPIEKSGTEPGF